jgi:hypothetical protein
VGGIEAQDLLLEPCDKGQGVSRPLSPRRIPALSDQTGRELACQEQIQGQHPEPLGLNAVPGHEEEFLGQVHQPMDV